MSFRTTSCSVVALAAAALLSPGCSSARLDPLEFDYYSTPAEGRGDGMDTASRGAYIPAPVGSNLSPRVEATPAPASSEPVVLEPAAASAGATSHRVQKGDSLYSLSTRYLGSGKRWREIAQLNGLGEQDVTRLPVGREIKIPAR